MNSSVRRQKGLSLVEVMIAITISMILTGGVVEVFTSSRKTYDLQDSFARLQEGGRFALEFLTRDLRMAGSAGCGSRSLTVNNIVKPAPGNPFLDLSGGGAVAYTQAQLAATGSDGGSGLAAVAGLVLPNTDVLVIKGATPVGVQLFGNASSNTAQINLNVAAQTIFTAGDVIVITDCVNADIFTATNVSNGAGMTNIAHAIGSNQNFDNKLSTAYRADQTQVIKFTAYAYYIGKNAKSRPALFRRSLANVGTGVVDEELVEGVENLRVMLGEDLDNDRTADRYLRPDNAVFAPTAAFPNGDFTKVVSVRIGLLVQTPEEVGISTDTKTYDVNNTPSDTSDDLAGYKTSGSADRRLRKLFGTTVQLRNRG